MKWKTVKTVGYDGRFETGPNVDRRACGGVVHIQERNRKGRTERRAIVTNGRFSFIAPMDPLPWVRRDD